MGEVKVICPGCGDLVHHHCHTDVKNAVIDLLSWVPETQGFANDKLNKAFEAAGRKEGWIGDDETLEQIFAQPFFGTQAWVYPLFGSKDTARSFFAYLHNLIRACNLDPDEIRAQIYAKRKAREDAEAERKAGVQKRKDERATVIAFLKGDAPLEERIAKLDEILKARAKGLKPYARDDGEGFNHLYKYLDTYYGGGISLRINQARISKLETETFDAMSRQDA